MTDKITPSAKPTSPDSEINDKLSIDTGRQESEITTEYIQRHINGYAKHNFIGEQLWEAFVDDFEDFKTQSDWQRGDNFTVRSLRDMLRSKGVYIPKERGTSTISKHLANLVNSTSFPDWDTNDRDYSKVLSLIEQEPLQKLSKMKVSEEPEKLENLPFSEKLDQNSQKFEKFRPNRGENKLWRNEEGRKKLGYYDHDDNLNDRYQRPGPSEYYRARSYAPTQRQTKLNYNKYDSDHIDQTSQNQENFARYEISRNTQQISILERVYPEKLKYRGDGDTFDYKFHIFMSRCKQAAIPFEDTPTAFSVMLTGMALSFYYVHLDQIIDPTIDDLCSAMKERFENFEYRRNQQDAWYELKINDIINVHPEKSLSQCLQIFIEKIDEMKFGLPSGLKNDETVHHKIRSACEEHSAFTAVCDRSAPTINGLISDLQASASRYDRRKLKQNNKAENYITDRHYNFNRKGKMQAKPTTFKNPRFKLPDGCIVCSKKTCWSKNHPKHEIDEAFNKLKRNSPSYDKAFKQYLMDYEEFHNFSEGPASPTKIDVLENSLYLSEESESEMQNDDDLQKLPFEQNFSDIYFTSNACIDGNMAIEILHDRKFRHSIFEKLPTARSTNQSIEECLIARNDDSVNDIWLITSRYGNETFLGVIIDTGAAEYSTGGLKQFIALKKLYNDLLLDETYIRDFKFGKGSAKSIGAVDVKTPIGSVKFYIVELDIPFLLSLKDMDNRGVYFNNLRNLICRENNQSVGPHSIVRKFGHAFLVWGSPFATFITEELNEVQLRRLHRRFGHPSVDRLCNLLRKSGHEVHRQKIEKLTKYCLSCQKHGAVPQRFKFSIEDPEAQFNHSVLVDIFYINGQPVIHIVDEATRFQAAKWLKDMSTQSVWNGIRQCWIDTYLGPPDVITHDAGTQFTSKEFSQLAATLGISTESVPIEAHSAIGIVERYHGPLRRAYHVIKEELGDATNVSKDMVLQMAVKAVNDTAGPEGLVPTLLVFGAYPRMLKLDPPAPDMITRAKAVQKAMEEITKLRLNRKVVHALKERNGPRTDAVMDLPINSQVWVKREKEGWTGPWTLLHVDGQTCTVRNSSGDKNFRITSVKPYYDPDIEENYDNNQNSQRPDIQSQTILPANVDSNELNNEQEQKEPRRNPIRNRQQPQRYREAPTNFYTFFIDNLLQSENFLTQKELHHLSLSEELRKNGKITTPGPPFRISRQKELKGLQEREILQPWPRNLSNGRIFGLRFVDEVKNVMDKPYEKSRLVVKAFNDTAKHNILTQSPTIQRVSQRLILCIGASLMCSIKEESRNEFDFYLRDITQAYIQSRTKLNRDIFARPPMEMNLPSHLVLKINGPLYGIPESGTHWYNTYMKYHVDKLKMKPSTYDPCLLVTSCNDDAFGLLGIQTDDTFFVANQKFAHREEEQIRNANFATKPRKTLRSETQVDFNGAIIKFELSHITMQPKNQGERIQIIDEQIENFRDKYREQRARGAYIAGVCQPEASFDLSSAAQNQLPTTNDVKKLNKRLQWQIVNKSRGINFISLNLSTAKLYIFVDGSFAGNKDLSSQIGFVLVLANEISNNSKTFTIRGNILHWTSVKCRRVTRSVLASELYAMVSGIDIGIAIKTTIDKIFDLLKLPPVSIIACTDSYSLYDCLVKLGTTTEKRLMIDIMSLRESYEAREITEIRWIDGKDNPADSMTKSNPNGALQRLINDNEICVSIDGWVDREKQ